MCSDAAQIWEMSNYIFTLISQEYSLIYMENDH